MYLSPAATLQRKKALHKAAEMQGIEYKQYMRIRRRDGVTCD